MNTFRINSNPTSALAYRNLSKTQSGLHTTLERLSSGMRINKAADDSAGSAISSRMSNQIRGMKQANRNAQQANNLIQTAENGLNNINDILSRMRELAVQASTDTLNDTDRASIKLEFQASKNEIGRIADSTKYNGISLLKGFNPKMDFLSGQSYKVSNATASKLETTSIPVSTTSFPKTSETPDMPHVSNEIIVRFSTETLDNLNIEINGDNKSIATSSNQINQLFEEMQVIEIAPVFTTKISPLSQFYKLKLAPNQQVTEIIQELNDNPVIESAELNYIVKKKQSTQRSFVRGSMGTYQDKRRTRLGVRERKFRYYCCSY
jgi:flagellin